MGKDNDRSLSVAGDQESVSSATHQVELDNEELISRITSLQHEKWQLEERVAFLEQSHHELVDGVARKNEVIENYVKDRPVISPSTSAHTFPSKLPDGLRKVVDDVKRFADPSQSDIKDMNRRLQLMLEETLTKNMHLTKDIELLSQEVSRLSGASA